MGGLPTTVVAHLKLWGFFWGGGWGGGVGGGVGGSVVGSIGSCYCELWIQPVPGLESVLVIELIYMHTTVQVLLLQLIYGMIFTLILRVPARMMLRSSASLPVCL